MRAFLTTPVALVAVAVFSLAGCGGGDDAPADTTADTTTESSPTASTTAPATTPEGKSSASSSSASTSGASPQTHSGELAAGDETLQTGEYVDSYGLTVREGQTVIVDATTDGGLDPYVILRSPDGEQAENDDFEGSRTHARVEHVATEAGHYDAMVTSYEAAQTGTYSVTITVRD